jgi:hypothetical protein
MDGAVAMAACINQRKQPAKVTEKEPMFESQYNEEMEAEVMRLEAKKRAAEAGHPEWNNACTLCGAEIADTTAVRCNTCIK